MKPALLIVEGDATLCAIYQKYLTDHGYEVETARDGLSCLAKLRQAMPAVLVLDRELHWGGGDGVLAWLREQSLPSEVPVVLTSTGVGSLDGAIDIKPPVVKFLPKPFTLTELLNSVRAAVAKQEDKESFYLAHDVPCSGFFIG
jgi:chemosensory pili system protein ChpA (sensor histidine kinase/response regulator)